MFSLARLAQQADPNRVMHQRRAAVEVELVDDVAAVRLHGVDAERQTVGYLLVGVAGADQRQDLALTRCQTGVGGPPLATAEALQIFLHEPLGEWRVEEYTTTVDRLDRCHELGRGR